MGWQAEGNEVLVFLGLSSHGFVGSASAQPIFSGFSLAVPLPLLLFIYFRLL